MGIYFLEFQETLHVWFTRNHLYLNLVMGKKLSSFLALEVVSFYKGQFNREWIVVLDVLNSGWTFSPWFNYAWYTMVKKLSICLAWTVVNYRESVIKNRLSFRTFQIVVEVPLPWFSYGPHGLKL